MMRWLVVGLATAGLVGTVGVVGTTAAAGGSPADGAAPDKTQPPTTGAPGAVGPSTVAPSSVPPLATNPPLQTAPPTSAWIATTTPTTLAPITVPTTVPGPAVTASTAVPVTSFDGLKWLTDVYAAVADDPFALLDISEQSVVINTPADLFVAHLLGVAITEQVDAGIDPPAYTVTAEGKAVRVCAGATLCDVFSDFYAPTGLLESFSINGAPLAVSASTRRVNVESLTIESALCRLRSDGVLSCALLLTSEGASTALHFDQSSFTATDGRQFGPDPAASVFTRSINDGGFGSAHLLFPGAPLEGDIAVPIVSGMSGTPTTATVTVTEV